MWLLFEASERAAPTTFRVERGSARRVVEFEWFGPGASPNNPGMDVGMFGVVAGGRGGGAALAWNAASLSVEVVTLTVWLMRGGNDAYHEEAAWYYDGGPPGEGRIWRLKGGGTVASRKSEAIDKANARGVELVRAANAGAE